MSAGLPFAESPPVSAMPSPILIGSAARTGAPATASVMATAPTSATPSRLNIRNRFIDALSSISRPSRPAWPRSYSVRPFGATRSRSEERRERLGVPAGRTPSRLQHLVAAFVVEQGGRGHVDRELLDLANE